MSPALSDGPRACPARIRMVVAMGAAVEKTRAKAMPVVVATSAADGRAAAGRCRVGAVIPHVARYCGVVGLRMKHREIGEADMMGRREAVLRGGAERAMEEESHGGRRGMSLRAARAREAEERRGRMGGGGRRRALQAAVCRGAAGRHGGAWSVVALLPSCAACASLERVRPAAWRRRGAALPRPHLCSLVRGKECVLRGCVARVRLSRLRARWWEGARCVPRLVRVSLRHAPMWHVLSPFLWRCA